MKNVVRVIGVILLFLPIACKQRKADIIISTDSLLKEMVSRESLALFPQPYYETRQFSSYDRASVDKDSSSWYANRDRSQFIREENKSGRREFVVFDSEGSGAITRFWVTVADYSGKGIIRFYIDGKTEPEIEGEVLNVIGGQSLVGYPLSASVSELTDHLQRGHNLYLPIPYSKSCKITYESPSIKEPGEFSGECFYYNINYRTYEAGTKVLSFSKDDLEKNKDLIDRVNQKLLTLDCAISDSQKQVIENKELSHGDSVSLCLKGEKAVKKLQIKLKAEDYYQALRSTVLSIIFDGKQRVWSPLGDFMGVGNRLSSYKTFYTEVTSDSLLSCYWVMPFQDECIISIKNLNPQKVDVSCSVWTSPWDWTDNSMYFCAGWTEYNRLYTGKHRNMKGTNSQFDINFVSLHGAGVYVGDCVTLFNSLADWWGEGDEKIYIDGEKFPSHFGTGTEDYYGYAWCMHNYFQHPFIAQPDGSGDTQCGHVSNVRYRALDAIPFTKSLDFDMEIWHWGSTFINYAPTTYFYLLPDGESNRHAEDSKAIAKIAKHKNDLVPNWPDEDGYIEGEYMDVQLSSGLEKSQTIADMHWSNEAQFFWGGEHNAGDYVNLGFEVKKEGEYILDMNITNAPDYGCFDLYLNDKLLKSNLNCYSSTPTPNLYSFGKVRLKSGDNTLRFVQKTKNISATNNYLGIDFIRIRKL